MLSSEHKRRKVNGKEHKHRYLNAINYLLWHQIQAGLSYINPKVAHYWNIPFSEMILPP